MLTGEGNWKIASTTHPLPPPPGGWRKKPPPRRGARNNWGANRLSPTKILFKPLAAKPGIFWAARPPGGGPREQKKIFPGSPPPLGKHFPPPPLPPVFPPLGLGGGKRVGPPPLVFFFSKRTCGWICAPWKRSPPPPGVKTTCWTARLGFLPLFASRAPPPGKQVKSIPGETGGQPPGPPVFPKGICFAAKTKEAAKPVFVETFLAKLPSPPFRQGCPPPPPFFFWGVSFAYVGGEFPPPHPPRRQNM